MSEEHVPLWKKHLAKANTPEAQQRAKETRRANASVKEALLNAFDTLGNEAFFVRLGNGTDEDRRCLAMILAKLIPLEVQGAVDHTLTVKIVKQVGDREVLIDGGPTKNFGLPPKDAVTGERVEMVGHQLTDINA